MFSQSDQAPWTHPTLPPGLPHTDNFQPIAPSPSPSPSPSSSWSAYDTLPGLSSALGYATFASPSTVAPPPSEQPNVINQYSPFTTSYQAASQLHDTLQPPTARATGIHATHPIQSGRAVLAEINGPQTQGQGKKRGQTSANVAPPPAKKRPRRNQARSGGQAPPVTLGQAPPRPSPLSAPSPSLSPALPAPAPPSSSSNPAVYGVGPSPPLSAPAGRANNLPVPQSADGSRTTSSMSKSRRSSQDAWLFTWPIYSSEQPVLLPPVDSESVRVLMKERGSSPYLGCKLCLYVPAIR